jgi:hypothetical protein
MPCNTDYFPNFVRNDKRINNNATKSKIIRLIKVEEAKSVSVDYLKPDDPDKEIIIC